MPYLSMLLTLVVIAVLFIFTLPILKNTGDATGSGNPAVSRENIEAQVNKQVEEIENIRRQNAIDMEKVNQEY